MVAGKVETVWQGDLREPSGLAWLPGAEVLLICDREGGRVFSLDPASATASSIAVGGQPGFVFPTSDGELLFGSGTDLLRVDADGAIVREIRIDTPPVNRAGIGTVDARGRLWFGLADSRADGTAGGLYRYHDERMIPMCLDQNRPGGVGLTDDARTLYQAIASERRIDRHAVNRAGALSERQTIVTLADGEPGGLAVDAEGAIWVTVHGAGMVRRYAGDGAVLAEIALPGIDPLDLAFGGEGGATLYISTTGGTICSIESGVAGTTIAPVRLSVGASLGLIEDDDH